MQKKSMSEVLLQLKPVGHAGPVGSHRSAQTSVVVHSPSMQSASLVHVAP
jgi:hypothetical protein